MAFPAFTALTVLLVLSGCAQQGTRTASEALDQSAAETSGDASVSALMAEPAQPAELDSWCRAWQPASLQNLTEQALQNNRELAAAQASLRASEATARAAAAGRWPLLNLNGSAQRGRQPFLTDIPEDAPFDLETTLTRYRAGLAAQYELDLWGSIANERDAAALQANASANDLRTARVTLAAEVAETWFELLTQQELVALLEAELAASQQMLELTQLRFSQGQAEGLDIVQQRQQEEFIQGQLVLARARVPVTASQLDILLSREPREDHEADGGLPFPEQLPLEGVPANLLRLRPDLAAAEQRMIAADHRYAAAVAQRLPSVQLSTQLFGEARSINDVFETLFWNVLGSVNLVAFDGGRLRAQADAADARAQAALEEFAQAYLTALIEVRNSLLLEQTQRVHLESLERQQNSAERALELARDGYRNGLFGYLRVLNTQQSLLQTRRSFIEGRRQLLSYRSQTCRALGFAPDADDSDRPAREESSHE